MLYGIEIDEAYLSRMTQYKGQTVTQADMARVAIGQKGTYQGDAEKKQAEMKGEYGLGCVSACVNVGLSLTLRLLSLQCLVRLLARRSSHKNTGLT